MNKLCSFAVVLLVLAQWVAFSSLVHAKGTFSHGTVVALQGTDHIWIADNEGVLHWASDTRALSGRHIDWSTHVEVSVDRLKALARGAPWLSAGLLKIGSQVYLVKWEHTEELPTLLRVLSLADIELFGIDSSSYTKVLLEKAAWERQFGIPVETLRRGELAPLVPRTVVINEVLVANRAGLSDEDGDPADWLELYNASTQPVALRGYTITDDLADPAKWALPARVLAPGDFLLIWASGKDRRGESLHTNFRLDSQGEYLGLFTPNRTLVDAIVFGAQQRDVSLGRDLNGRGPWVFFQTPTPGGPNTTLPSAGSAAPPLLVSPASSAYDGPISVTLQSPQPGVEIRYTLDGAAPTVSGQHYQRPVELSQTAVLRAVAFHKGVPVSQEVTHTYLIGEQLGLPVLSLVTDPANLWDTQRGIYTNPSQRGRGWERPVVLHWLDRGGILRYASRAGLRIHGFESRAYSEKKSLRVYFREKYGPTRLRAHLFSASPVEGFDALVLRSGYQDSWLHRNPDVRASASYLRDQLVRDLHRDMGQIAAHGTWTLLYLNGSFWGLYNVTERIDEDFLTSYLGHSQWDVVKGDEPDQVEGNEAFQEFLAWITTTDLSQDHQYREALKRLDIESFTSYYILNIWAQAGDFLIFNWYAARPRGVPAARWRLFIWDAELTLGAATMPVSVAEDTFLIALKNDDPLGRIFSRLMQSPWYRRFFALQLERSLAGVLGPEHVIARIDALAAVVRPAMAAEAHRWSDYSIADWDRALQWAKRFARARGPVVRAHVQHHLAILDEQMWMQEADEPW